MVFQKVSLSRLKVASKISRIDPTKADFGRLLKVNINGRSTCEIPHPVRTVWS